MGDVALVNNFVNEIRGHYQKTVNSIFEIGEALKRARHELDRDDYNSMCENKLPFGPRTADRYIQVASDERLRDEQLTMRLPASYATLAEIAGMDDDKFADIKQLILDKEGDEITKREVLEIKKGKPNEKPKKQPDETVDTGGVQPPEETDEQAEGGWNTETVDGDGPSIDPQAEDLTEQSDGSWGSGDGTEEIEGRVGTVQARPQGTAAYEEGLRLLSSFPRDDIEKMVAEADADSIVMNVEAIQAVSIAMYRVMNLAKERREKETKPKAQEPKG